MANGCGSGASRIDRTAAQRSRPASHHEPCQLVCRSVHLRQWGGDADGGTEGTVRRRSHGKDRGRSLPGDCGSPVPATVAWSWPTGSTSSCPRARASMSPGSSRSRRRCPGRSSPGPSGRKEHPSGHVHMAPAMRFRRDGPTSPVRTDRRALLPHLVDEHHVVFREGEQAHDSIRRRVVHQNAVRGVPRTAKTDSETDEMEVEYSGRSVRRHGT